MATNWFEDLTAKFFSGMSKKEVKTPLSFFFRVALAVSVITLLALYLDQSHRMIIFLVGMGVIVLLFLGVLVFAWFNPKNLVYGETSHRAESKFAFGTETKELSVVEVSTLEGTPNQKALSGGA